MQEHVEVQACTWAMECSVVACDEQCVANPALSTGLDIPQLVNERSLAAYACPTFSALIKLWNMEMASPTGTISRQVPRLANSFATCNRVDTCNGDLCLKKTIPMAI